MKNTINWVNKNQGIIEFVGIIISIVLVGYGAIVAGEVVLILTIIFIVHRKFGRIRASKLWKIITCCIDRVREITKVIPDFVATEQVNNEYGCFFKKVEVIKDRRIKDMSFTLESKSRYWRAGFKIYSPNGNFQPLGEVREGILFHLAHPGDQKRRIWLLTRTASRTFQKIIDMAATYRIEMSINKNNFMTCLVNGEKCFGSRINPVNLENARLCAWADYEGEQQPQFRDLFLVRKFKVRFSDIRYTTSI